MFYTYTLHVLLIHWFWFCNAKHIVYLPGFIAYYTVCSVCNTQCVLHICNAYNKMFRFLPYTTHTPSVYRCMSWSFIYTIENVWPILSWSMIHSYMTWVNSSAKWERRKKIKFSLLIKTDSLQFERKSLSLYC